MEIREYIAPSGKNPFRRWLDSLAGEYKARVQARLLRIELGNLGDFKSLGDGVNELRFDFGQGYRVYFGFDGRTIVILLCGGDKSSQRKDIAKAKEHWQDYLGEKKNG